ncbi:MAG: hypothetical protein IJ705_06900, partial [Oscillospiraceae bacterium]|nr:hypothetical protein [Oscillospiraceae bacterium]
ELRGAADTAEELWRSLRSAGEELSKAGEALQKGGGVSLSPVSDAARESSAALFGALSEMSEQMSALEGVLNSTGDALSEDLRAINSQMNSIFRIATDAVTDARSVSADDAVLVEDASDVNVEGIRAGKLELCRNEGAVDGDRNVGGVVGSMAIEYELDPENDLTGSLRFGSVFETRAVALRCVNSGAVTAKKDCAGGIAGEMDLGSVIECENYGDVESTDGSYAGGIAGLSRGMLRSCWSKCRVSALSYLGGVAGDAEKLMGCRAIAAIDGAGKPYAGAVAGFADPAGGQVRENLFLDLGEAGIDGVSYAGIAESAEFEALCGWEAVPDAFTRFHLTLSADGKLVSRIPFRYGRDLRRVSLPQIPRKEGFYAAWPDFDRSGRVSDLYVEAVYTPWITLLPSPQREGERALVLAEGEFTAAAVLDAAAEAMAPPEGTKEGRPLRLSLQGAGNPGALPLRFLNTAGKNAALWQYADGQWRKLDSVLNGGYLMALAPAEGVYCVCVPDGAPLWLIPCAAGAALLAFCAALLGRRRSKQRKQAQNHAKEAENAENTENTETQKS